jgi:alkanesulfonate monooxygenase SsuD/methylene tetrahydromethanopterin reductase-like flavin-dependent oxidoreductase (luciferase family)
VGRPEFSLDGEHFQVREARIEPKPAHRIPIWTGAYGQRALRLTGQLADGWIPSIGRIGLDKAVALRDQVLGSLEQTARRARPFRAAAGNGASARPPGAP